MFITHGIAEAVFLSDRVIVMSPRPGVMIEECVIDLPRPRDMSVLETPAFGSYVAHIRRRLESQMPAAQAAAATGPGRAAP
jgi:NitT/TauT family transport system ATP-binding protein